MRKFKSECFAIYFVLLISVNRVSDGDEIFRHEAQVPRVLNNFVTEILSVEELADNQTHLFRIVNPRTGWLFFRLNGWAGRSGVITMTISPAGDDGTATQRDVMQFDAGEKTTDEVMRHLPQGAYELRVRLADAELKSLIVRTIPIIVYERVHGSFRGMIGFPNYDQDFLTRCGMLASCNTIGTYDGFRWMPAWQTEGKQAIRIAGGIHNVTSLEGAYQFWRGCMNHPTGVNGIIIDEFYPSLQKHFPAWVEALQRVRKDEPGKLWLLYTAGGADSLRDLIEPLKDLDFYWTPEEQVEESRETEEDLVTRGFARSWVKGFQDYFPNVSERFRTNCPFCGHLFRPEWQ